MQVILYDMLKIQLKILEFVPQATIDIDIVKIFAVGICASPKQVVNIAFSLRAWVYFIRIYQRFNAAAADRKSVV